MNKAFKELFMSGLGITLGLLGITLGLLLASMIYTYFGYRLDFSVGKACNIEQVNVE